MKNMKNRLLKILVNIALFIFPTLFSVLVFSNSGQPKPGSYGGTAVLLVIGVYIITIILIIVAYKFKVCNLWVLAVGLLLAYVPETKSSGHMINLFPGLGAFIFFLLYKIPAFIAAISLAVIRERNKERDDTAPEDDPRRE